MAGEFVWCVLQVRSGFEDKVGALISGSDVYGKGVEEVFVPPQSIPSQAGGSKRAGRAGKRVYAGYVFVNLAPEGDICRKVLAIPYVLRFLMHGDDLKVVDQDEVDAIRENVVSEEVVHVEFLAGDDVQIISGPFESFCGVVESMDQAAKSLIVVITIFGRPNPVRLGFLEVKKVDNYTEER